MPFNLYTSSLFIVQLFNILSFLASPNDKGFEDFYRVSVESIFGTRIAENSSIFGICKCAAWRFALDTFLLWLTCLSVCRTGLVCRH